MSIRSSGYWCDVCNTPIMGAFFNISPKSFTMPIFDNVFHTHDKKCLELLKQMTEEEKVDCLPDNSPIKIAVLNHLAKIGAKNANN